MKRRSKKFIVFAGALLIASLFVDQAKAHTATSSASPVNPSATSSAVLESSASASPQLLILKNRQDQVRATVAQLHAQRVQSRFDFYYHQLSLLSEGLEKQIDDLPVDNDQVASTSAELIKVDAQLEAAKFLADEASHSYEHITARDYDNQKTQSLEARELTQSAKEAFAEVLAMYKDILATVKSIKE